MSKAEVNKVSIIIPVFNRENYISETIESVLSLDWTNWELLLIDDGSNDNSLNICREYAKKDNRIFVFTRINEPKGASACRNIGIRESKSEWIIFLDSDDLLAPWCLKQRIQKINEGDVLFDFLIFPMLLFKEKPDDLMLLQNINSDIHPLDRFLQRENPWLMSSLIWSKKYLIRLNGFREEALSFQDWEINVRALIESDNWRFFDFLIPDNFYRQHGETISNSRFSMEHLANNIETFISCFSFLRLSDKFEERRRKYFALLIFEWLKRFSAIKMAKSLRKDMRKNYISICSKMEIFNAQEKMEIEKYFKFSDSPLFLRMAWLRKRRDNRIERFLTQGIAKSINKTQGKINYTGKLPWLIDS